MLSNTNNDRASHGRCKKPLPHKAFLPVLERVSHVKKPRVAHRGDTRHAKPISLAGMGARSKPEHVREAHEGKIRARWKLGRLLRQIERPPAGRPKIGHPVTNFVKWATKELGLAKATLVDAQRIGAMPEPKLEQALARYRGAPVGASVS